MNEIFFWEYIDLKNEVATEGLGVRDIEERQIWLIEEKLFHHSFEEVLEFHRIFSEKIYELFLPTLAEVFMVSHSNYDSLKKGNVYISNDGFRDFRSWIIGLGREEFENFKAYQKEEDFLKYDLHPDKAYREDLEYIIVDLYEGFKETAQDLTQLEKIYERKYDFFYDGDYQSGLEEKIDWANINKKYPRLLQRR